MKTRNVIAGLLLVTGPVYWGMAGWLSAAQVSALIGVLAVVGCLLFGLGSPVAASATSRRRSAQCRWDGQAMPPPTRGSRGERV
jgi:hypothetical protein